MAKLGSRAVLRLLFVISCISSAHGDNMGPECSNLKEIQVHHKDYYDIYLGNDPVTQTLNEKGIFMQVTKAAVEICCSTAKLSFHQLDPTSDREIEAFVYDAIKADRNNPNNSIIKLFGVEYAYKKSQYVYDSQKPFLGLYRSPGPALVMKRPPAKEPVFLGDIFVKSFAIVLFLVSSAWIVGILVWVLDHHSNRKDFPNPFYVGMMEGCWWSIVTMTTVGYGDKTPKGPLARLLAVVWIMISTVFLSLFTANASSILAISQAEEDYTNTIGKTIGCFNSQGFFSVELNIGARWVGYKNVFSVTAGIESGDIDRLVFPNYLDWLILISKPGHEKLDKDFMLTNALDHPFQIGLAFAVDPMNMTLTDESFIKCMRRELPVLAKRIRHAEFGDVPDSKLEHAMMKDEEKVPLDNDSLLTLIYGCLVLIGCIMPLGLAWDFWMYWEKNRHQKRRREKQPGDVEMVEVSNIDIDVGDQSDFEDAVSNQSPSVSNMESL